MLRRRSTRSRRRRSLSRSKSASSVGKNVFEKLDSIDPITAQRDAQTAATLSFQRARGGTLAMARPAAQPDYATMNDQARRRCNTSNVMTEPESREVRSSLDGFDSGLQRRQSVRFAGPKARFKRDLAPRASQGGGSSGLRKAQTDFLPPTQTLKGIAQMHGKSLGFHSLTRNYLRSLRMAQTSDFEEGGHTSQVGQHKLRKSKSMFSALDTVQADYYFGNGTPPIPGQVRRSRSRYAAHSLNADATSAAQGPDFPSCASAGTDGIILPQPGTRLAVRLARDKVLQQVEQQQQEHQHHLLRPQDSSFPSGHKQRMSSTAIRKSLRNSSHTSAGMTSTFSSQSLTISKQAGLRTTARRVSQSLRSKFKVMFHKPKPKDDFSGILSQQAESRESCADEDPMTIGEASMSRVASHVPSLHAVPSSQQMQSRKGSVESLEVPECTSDDKSRVTSWTNSVTNTLPSQSVACEWERQRLSIIKENGMHISSSSLPRPSQGPLPDLATSSDRVYAALMERLRDSRVQDDQYRAANLGGSPKDSNVLRRATSTEDCEPPPTIRCVAPEDDVFLDRPAPSSTAQDTGVRPILKNVAEPPSEPHVKTPDLARCESRRSNRSKTISHRSSGFFGSPSTHIFRTTSPYRRARQEETKQTEGCQNDLSSGSQYLYTLSPLALPPQRPGASTLDDFQTQGSDGSVYSGNKEDPCQHPWVEEGGPISQFSPPLSVVSTPCGIQLRPASTSSSVDWKKWLSADLAKQECSPGHTRAAGHVREKAEIESSADQPGHGTSRLKLTSSGTPLSPVAPNFRSSSLQRTPRNLWGQGLQRTENERPEIFPRPVVRRHNTPHIPLGSAQKEVPLKSGAVERSAKEPASFMRSSSERWPLIDSAKAASSRGPSVRTAPRTRSRLNSVVTNSPEPSALFQHEDSCKRPFSASPEHSAHWDLDKTLHRLRLRDSRTTVETSNGEADIHAHITSSKRMVDMFLRSRRRIARGTRSRSTSDSSPAAFL